MAKSFVGSPNAPVNPTNSGTTGQVPTRQSDGTDAWADPPGIAGVDWDTSPTYGDIPVFDDTTNKSVPTRGGAPVYSVKDPILYDPPGAEAARMVRSAGSDAQTTATTTASSTTVTLADASTYQRGNGIAISGAGASHGLSAPANCYAIPISVYQTAPASNETLAPIPFTVDATNNTILLTPTSSNASNQILMPWAPGTRVRLSQQGSTFPTLASGAFAEGTDYYVAPLPETTTVAMSGTATGGTFRLYLAYKAENQFFHDQQDSSLYCSPVYNAGWEVQTVTVINTGGSPGGSFTLTLSGYGTTGAISWNASTATTATNIQTALRAVTGLSRVTVAFSSGDFTAGAVFTIHFNGAEGNLSQMTSADSMSGSSHSVAHATVSNGTATSFQTYLRTLPGCAQVTVDQSGTGPNFTHAITWTGVQGRVSLQYDLAGLTGGTPACAVTSTRSGGYTVHDTEAHAIAGTDIFDPTGSGSGFVSEYGSRTHAFQAAALSGKGGVTAASTSFNTTTGPLHVNEFSRIALCCDHASGHHGVVFYDATSGDEKVITAVSQLTNIFRVNLNASGYTNYEFGDIGKTFSDGTLTGTIQCFDNTSRNVWVLRNNATGFPTNGATITTTSGTGGGTQNGASVRAYVYMYTGKVFKRKFNYYAPFNRKGGEKIYPGQVMEHNGNLYTAIEVTENRKTAPDTTFTVNTTTNVITFATGLSLSTNGTRLHLYSSMALPNSASGRLSPHGAYYGRFSGSTATLHPTSADAIANTNVIDLTDAGYGTHYVQNPPTFSTTLGAFVNDGNVLWQRRNQGYPQTPPASAINDLHLAIVMSKSGSNVVLSAAPSTSVTSQLATHDDTESLLANHNAANASGAKSATVHVPTGNYVSVLIQPNSDTRLYNHAFGSGSDYSLFRWGSDGTTWKSVRWQGDAGARIIFATTFDQSYIDGVSGFDTAVGGMAIHTIGRADVAMRDLTVCNWPLTSPVSEHPAGEGGLVFYSGDGDSTSGASTSAGSRMGGPKFQNVRFHAWANVGGATFNQNYARAELFEDCEIFGGGCNHNYLLYLVGGNLIRTYICGVRAENSMLVYHDYDNGLPLNVDGCLFERGMKDGSIAVRSSEVRIVNSKFYDCVQLFVREITDSFVVDNCDFYNTALNPISATGDCARDIRISNVRMVDSGLNIGTSTNGRNVNIRDVQTLRTARPMYLTGTANYLVALNGVNQTVDGITIDSRDWQTDARCVQFGGNGTFANVKVLRSAGTWATFVTTGSGYMVLDRCEFWTRAGGSTACLISHTGEMKVLNCRFDGHTYTWDGGGRTDFEGCTLGTGAFFTFGTGITGPVYVRRNQWNGAVFYNEPSMIIEDNNHAVAASITGATQSTRGNRVADSVVASPGTLSSGVTNNYALGIQNIHRITPNGSGSTLGGIVARADGNHERLINAHASASLILDDDAGGSTSTNRYFFAALTIPAGGEVVISYDNTSAVWRLVSQNF